jgi:hypothetical protein
MSRLAASLVAILLIIAPVGARAQVSAAQFEFGGDAALSVLFDPSAVVLNIPVSEVRVGFFVTPRLELEPRLNLTLARGDDGDTFTETHFTFGALFHLEPARSSARTYFRPFASVSSLKFSGSEGTTAVALGAGLGVKRPIGDRFAFRPELNFAHTFARENVEDESRVQLLVGFSVFSR